MVKTAVFFDIGGTPIRGASTRYLARDLFSRGYSGLDFFFLVAWQSLLYVIFGESRHRLAVAKERSLRILKGRPESGLIPAGEELYDRFLQGRLLLGTLGIVQKHLDAGHEVRSALVIPCEISRQMAYRLKLIGGLGIVVEVDENGRYAGKIPQSLFHGAMKVQAVQDLARGRHLDLPSCYAYFDSMSDEELFNPAGHPYVINPEWELRNLAKHRHWPIRDFARWRPSMALATRTILLPAVIVGSVWTAKIPWRHVLRRLFQMPVWV